MSFKAFSNRVPVFGGIVMFVILSNAPVLFAHGGADPGPPAPAAAASATGTVTYVQRLGGLEVMIKQPQIEPDTAAAGSIFLTDFATNAPVANAEPSVQIESANGSQIEARVAKTDSPGTYSLNLPALPQGTYTLRTSVKYDGKTDTAVFPGVKVAHPEAGAEAAGETSWLQILLIVVVSAVLLALFGSLIFFVWRLADEQRAFTDEKQVHEETVAA